jgi:hypothetical protein
MHDNPPASHEDERSGRLGLPVSLLFGEPRRFDREAPAQPRRRVPEPGPEHRCSESAGVSEEVFPSYGEFNGEETRPGVARGGRMAEPFHQVAIKRVYEPPARGDGVRIATLSRVLKNGS